MDRASFERKLRDWLDDYDPEQQNVAELFGAFVTGLQELGYQLLRCSMWLPTAHPELWGLQVIWQPGTPVQVLERFHDIARGDGYLNTPGEEIHRTRASVRYRLMELEEAPYPLLDEFKAEGATDYLMVPFRTGKVYEQPWVAFATNDPAGFDDDAIAFLEELCRPLGWKMRVAMAEWSAQSLLRVYLGARAARRVWDGEFRRGTGSEQRAAVWFCDLRGFTSLGDSMEASQLVPLLDEYFDRVASAIEARGGEILKLIGDAVLAVFPCDAGDAAAAENALHAAGDALAAMEAWSAELVAAGGRAMSIGIGLHLGGVMYGNIGASSRLDFTVIGAAVNEAARLESMTKTKSVPLLMSQTLADALGRERCECLGEVSLRGVREPQQVYTWRFTEPSSG